MSHLFLSEAWFEATSVLAEKYADQLPEITERAKINMIVTATPFGNEPVRTYLDTSSGQMLLAKGSLDEADCTVTTDYETCTALLVQQDQQGVMQAFMAGKIKVQGDMAKLMVMMMAVQTAPASPVGLEAAEAVKAITTIPAS
jgi:SCP-2 sterol transfer family